VKNTDGENLGDIKDLMLNLNTGTVEYAILEFGTFLGMGGKLFAIPFRELKASPDKDGFILDRDKQYLKDSPGFDSTHWPDTNDHSYFTSVDTYYDVVPPFP
jgi:sporulation protein YlmC with PRC-barrel domain